MTAGDPDAFSRQVTEEYTWRLKEISDIKQVVKLSGSLYESVARKAALTLVYAHWEGYVLAIGHAFLEYVAKRKFKFSSLQPAFSTIKMGSHISSWQRSKDTVGLRLAIIEIIREIEGDQFKSVPNTAITTGGNLNFERFSDLCRVLSIDPNKIVKDPDYLDREIVGVRNRIAHGESIVVNEDSLLKAIDCVLDFMRAFRTDIENCIVSGHYKLTP